METLEERRLLDASGDCFDIAGTANNDIFDVRYLGSGTNEWLVRRNFVTVFNGALASPNTSLRILADDGQDAIRIRGRSDADSFQLEGSQILVNRFTVLGQDVESWQVNGDSGNDTFTVLDGFVGQIVGDSGTDQIIGPDSNNNWLQQGQDIGTLNTLTSFQEVESLLGGSLDDTFVFEDVGSVTSRVDGGDGVDQLDYSQELGLVTVNLRLSNANSNGRSPTIAGIESLVGSGSASHRLFSRYAPNEWSITGENEGTLNTDEIAFSGFGTLIGGTDTDRFVVSSGGSVTGSINGSNGIDHIELEDRGGPIDVVASGRGAK